MPSRTQFEELNNIAVLHGWMPQELGKTLLDVYISRAGIELNDSISSGWDLMAALSKCNIYAQNNQLADLIKHCADWKSALDAPDEGDVNSSTKFLEENEKLNNLLNQKNIKDELELDITQLLWKAYVLGLEEPFTLVLSIIKDHKKDWPATLEIYKNDK